MTRPIAIIGMGAEGPTGLSPRAREQLAAATWIAGGKRHLELIGPVAVETFTIRDNLDELVARLEKRSAEERCVVLASGDPLLYGIGHWLIESLGSDQLVIEPALSSMQLAFARAGLSWHDAAVATIHGRPLGRELIPLLGRPKIGLFTQDGSSPSAVARFFVERGLKRYHAWVGENLGAVDERVTSAPLCELQGRTFGPLNVMVLHREHEPPPVASGDGARIPDDAFACPDSGPILLTHADVRAVVLSRFRALPEGALWDIGAGLGGVSIALARTFPEREIVAVERSPSTARFLRINRERFGAYNLRIVEDEAPGRLANEESPSGVFLGGSGGQLDSILELVSERLVPGGTLVANFVTLENLSRTLDRLRPMEWPVEVAQVQVSHGTNLAGLTTLAPQKPVWTVRAVRP